MTEIVLPYDHSIVPQETYYWCGPASTQMVLNTHGIKRTENELARRIGTTENGTDHVGLIARVLNEELGGYLVRVMPDDPPTPAQEGALWDDIVKSINAGNGVVANIVAPRSNYPRGARGSLSPAYSGGTVYHYISIMGYADDETGHYAWVADSGFTPFGYWITLDQLASLIPPKGYTCKPVGDSATLEEVPTLFYTDRRVREVWEQLNGPTGHGWPQLGGRTVTDAIGAILDGS